jgi:hypothetical protein
MATRSTIGVLNSNGSVTAVYCHWDGYPEYNGKILNENYTTEEKVRELIELGTISSLGRQIGEKHPFSKFEDDKGEHPLVGAAKEARIALAEQEGWTTFYGRDRGETDSVANTFNNVAEFVEEFGEEYNYLFINGTWFVNDHGAMQLDQPVFDMVDIVLAQREAEEA